MAKLKYDFKSFFCDDSNSSVREYHNDNWISNGHFVVKKSILTKTYLRVVEKYPQDEEAMNKVVSIAKASRKIFESKAEDEKVQFVPDFIMKDFSKNTGNVLYDSNLGVILRQDYYNFITDRKCKIYMGEGRLNPLVIYDKDGEFAGIIMPVRSNGIDIAKEGENYKDYITELKQEQQEEKMAKAEFKKLSKKTLYISNNKAIVRKQPLRSLTEITSIDKYSNIFIEAEPKDNYAKLYLDLDVVYMNIGHTVRLDCLDDTDTMDFLTFLSEFTLEDYKETIKENLKEDKWINVAEIKLMELAGESEEYIQKLWMHRERIEKLRKEEKQKREKQKLREEKEYVKNQNEIVANLISEAEQSILDKKTVLNKEVTIYNDATNRYDNNTTSLILHLFKLYDIKLPLRTQGWVNKGLHSLKYSDGCWGYQYYSSSSDSTVFLKYLKELVGKIEGKYSITA